MHSCLDMGQNHQRGHSVQQSDEKVLEMYIRAAELGDTRAYPTIFSLRLTKRYGLLPLGINEDYFSMS